jgi:hypothetical protein
MWSAVWLKKLSAKCLRTIGIGGIQECLSQAASAGGYSLVVRRSLACWYVPARC